jgi:hypothetical protein
MRTGQGTLHWNNGDIYIGSFKDDKLHGQGKFIGIYGELWEGTWENDDFMD